MTITPQIFDLSGRVALVTGAGQGVGAGIATALAAFGATVVVNDYHAERADAVAADIVAAGGKAIAVQGDVTDFDSVGAMFERAAAEVGAVGILVNNAGNAGAAAPSLRPFWETGPQDWAPFTKVNYDGVFNCTRHALPPMIADKRGRIITIISDAGRAGEGNGLEAYSAAKAGAAGLMRGIARSVGRFGITANAVAIAITNTPTVAGFLQDETWLKKALANYIVRRVGEPDDVAAMVLYLASDASGWVTGQTYPVNGGFSLAL